MPTSDSLYHVQAVVTQILPDAFHETYDDGFAVFDAVVMKVTGPEEFPADSITVYLTKSEVASLNWLKTEAAVEFQIAADGLESDQLFFGALENFGQQK